MLMLISIFLTLMQGPCGLAEEELELSQQLSKR